MNTSNTFRLSAATAALLLLSLLSIAVAQETGNSRSETFARSHLPFIIDGGSGETSPAAPLIVSGQPAFTKQVIDDTVGETHAVVAADFDQDGDIDIAGTDFSDGAVLWYENDGEGAFSARVLDADLLGAYPAHVDDVDQDGRADVLAGGYLAHTFAWYHNEGDGVFTRREIDTAAMGAHSIVTSDLDDDGDIDFVTSTQDEYSTIAWYENDGASSFTIHPIYVEQQGARERAKRAEVADMDGDGDKDVVTASFGTNEVAWYENDGAQSFTRHVISTKIRGAYFVSLGDVDDDGDVDIFSASQNDDRIHWLRNDGNGIFKRLIIDDNAQGARTVLAVDLDHDGDLDALAASVDDDTIAWHMNDGQGGFTKKIIDDAADGAYGLFSVDMDLDGDLDVLSASRDANAIAVHTQSQAHEAQVERGGTLLIDGTLLLATDADNDPADLLYTVTRVPQEGQLELGGVALVQGEVFSQAQVNNGRLHYAHADESLAPDGFTFSLSDGGAGGVQPAHGFFEFIITGLPN